MRLLFVADGRSPIALNWMRYFVESGLDAHLVSTFECRPELLFSSYHFLPTGLSEFQRIPEGIAGAVSSSLRRLIPVQARTRIRQWVAPATMNRAAHRLAELVRSIQPDLVHAMRIPYEGMVASLATAGMRSVPLVISVWGNDFTLHAPSTPLMSRLTRTALSRTNALHTDCRRDLNLAGQWGFDTSQPAVVLPGAGGVHLDLFYPEPSEHPDGKRINVINPRGFRAYMRNDNFFKAIPIVLSRNPNIRFLCPAMEGESQAQRWVLELHLEAVVDLLPRQDQIGMASLYRRAQIMVSPSTHDGTPNTLLEAMASGCFPIAGDLDSLREWIEPGVNGILFDPGEPGMLAEAILLAAAQPDLRVSARSHNARLIEERADYRKVMPAAEEFYKKLISTIR